MENATALLLLLVKQGEGFTYENFGPKSEFGYPAAYSPDYLAWKTRVDTVIKRLFGPDSAQLRAVQAAQAVQVIGNGPDKFSEQQAYLLHALEQARLALSSGDSFKELSDGPALAPRELSNEVFIVHGHDTKAKAELEALIAEFGLEPVVLHRQPDGGRTLIEKFEEHSDVGFAVILLTPDEVAYLAADAHIPEASRPKEHRSRPNVIFEFGYFIGRLGRARVCCLHTGAVALPSDVSGILYKRFERSVEEVAYGLSKELRALGYRLK